VISTSDRKFNIIAYGIPESPPKTDKTSCQKNDMEAVLKSLITIDEGINPSFFKRYALVRKVPK